MIFRPTDEAQVVEVVTWACGDGVPLEVVGAGSKRALGRPVSCDHVLDLAALTGVTLYEPAELVLSARAGTPVVEIEAQLEQHQQLLAFEPGDWGPLLGAPAGAQTIGGVIACNLAGPRRVAAGAARDHFLGVRAVNGRGEAFKSGGRVVKNVTGYELCKPLAGSYGTLAAMTSVTVKVLPAPQQTLTLAWFGLADVAALRRLTTALNSPVEISGAAHLPASIAVRSSVAPVAAAGGAVTLVRLEGFAPSVAHRADTLSALFGGAQRWDRALSRTLWAEIRDVGVFCGDSTPTVWRLSVPPAAGATVVGAVVARLGADVPAYYDWGGGLIWLAVPGTLADAGAAAVRAALTECGGHATLIRAPEPIRATVDVFQPQAPALAALAGRVKDSFDPRHILNPGRMVPGW